MDWYDLVGDVGGSLYNLVCTRLGRLSSASESVRLCYEMLRVFADGHRRAARRGATVSCRGEVTRHRVTT